MLGPHQDQELVLEGGDVSPDLCRVELLVPLAKAVLGLLGDAWVGQDSLVWGFGRVVTLGDLRAVSVLLQEFSSRSTR